MEEFSEFSKEELILINEVLIKARDQSEIASFDMEKLMIDSIGSSDMKYYNQLLRKIEDSIKSIGVSQKTT